MHTFLNASQLLVGAGVYNVLPLSCRNTQECADIKE